MERRRWVVGNEPVTERLNLRRELAPLRRNPLYRLIRLIETERHSNRSIGVGSTLSESFSRAGRFIQAYTFFTESFSQAGRFNQAYTFYYLALERALPEISVIARGDPFFKYAKGYKYTPVQRKLAKRYHAAERYLRYDLLCCLLHSRILADRTIALSRYFLAEPTLPSFTSFNEHKKFFRKLDHPYGDQEEYATHIREGTGWFDSLKTVRDDFVVHHGKAKHYSMLGYRGSDNDVSLFFYPHGDHMIEFESSYMGTTIQLSIRRLSRDIGDFLTWFNAYGSGAFKDRQLKAKR